MDMYDAYNTVLLIEELLRIVAIESSNLVERLELEY